MLTHEQTGSRVVIGYDGSASSEAALRTGIEQARDRGLPLHIVSAVELPTSLPAYQDIYRRAAGEVLRGAVQTAVAALGTGRVTSYTEAGPASKVLLQQSQPEDLLVVGSHGHRPVARMLLGSTGTALSAHAPCPVLVVRGPRIRARGPVVVGVDGSAGSAAATAFAADAAARDRAPLRAVMALPPVSDALGFVAGPAEEEVAQARTALAAAVAGITVDHPDLPVEQLLAHTHPVEALLRHSRDARLVVVGSRGLGGLRAMVLGSVSREVLQHAGCPVAVVRVVPDRARNAALAG